MSDVLDWRILVYASTILFYSQKNYFPLFKVRYIYDVNENCPIFKSFPPPILAQLRPTFFHPLDPGRPIPPPWSWTSNFKRTSPLHLKTNQLKENLIQRWLFYLIRSLLQVGFRFPTNSLILCDFPVISFHLTEDNLDPRATCKN